MRRLLVGIAAVLILLAAVLLAVGPAMVERRANKVLPGTPAASAAAQELHKQLFVADMHGDSLLWNRDLLERADFAHIDLPRLQEGGVDLQVFTAPTQVPLGINYESNELGFDVVTLLSLIQLWPTGTWSSPTARAVYMAEKLDDFADRSNGKLVVVTDVATLEAATQKQQSEPDVVAGLLGIEGLHAIEGKLENLDVLYDAGYRMMAPTHFFDNRLGGSAHGIDKGGLTEFGARAVRKMEEKRIVIDLAHASPQLIDDVLAMATQPVVVSHTGVQGTCPGPRNLNDDDIRAIAAGGGLIGIGYWDAAVCDVSVAGIVKAMRYVTDLVGADHVALGSDFDGGTETPFDTSGLALITQGLLEAGFSEDQIRGIMGGNLLQLLKAHLPG